MKTYYCRFICENIVFPGYQGDVNVELNSFNLPKNLAFLESKHLWIVILQPWVSGPLYKVLAGNFDGTWGNNAYLSFHGTRKLYQLNSHETESICHRSKFDRSIEMGKICSYWILPSGIVEFIFDLPDGGVKLVIFCLLIKHTVHPASLTNFDCCLTTCMCVCYLLFLLVSF